MPRRPAIVTQADIARAIRAVQDAGAGKVRVDDKGIHIEDIPPAPAPGEEIPQQNQGFNRLKTERLKTTEDG
jgi:hypothetical protein